eukprot:4514021-Pyramimonas_sp.AAC.1
MPLRAEKLHGHFARAVRRTLERWPLSSMRSINAIGVGKLAAHWKSENVAIVDLASLRVLRLKPAAKARVPRAAGDGAPGGHAAIGGAVPAGPGDGGGDHEGASDED